MVVGYDVATLLSRTRSDQYLNDQYLVGTKASTTFNSIGEKSSAQLSSTDTHALGLLPALPTYVKETHYYIFLLSLTPLR